MSPGSAIRGRLQGAFDPGAWAVDGGAGDRRRVRRAVKRAAFATGLGPVLRRMRESFEPADAKRSRREDEHLRLLLAFALHEDANCIDVGANEGAVLTDILRYAPRGRHIAYEPLPSQAERLAAEFPGVEVRRTALSNEDGTASFTHVRTRPSYSGLRERDYPEDEELEHISVRVERLDESLPDGYVPHLIKIDVEGGERLVLEGALATIARHRPTIVFEHTKGAAEHYDTGPDDIFTLLCDEAGLRIFDLEGDGPYTRGAFRAAFEARSHDNYVARP